MNEDKRMLKNLKKQLSQMFDQSAFIDADFYWKYDKNGGNEPPELRIETTLEFDIPEDNFDVAVRRLDELKDELDELSDPDGDIRMW